jgi:hypothetical protein
MRRRLLDVLRPLANDAGEVEKRFLGYKGIVGAKIAENTPVVVPFDHLRAARDLFRELGGET